MQKVHMKQNINIWLINVKNVGLRHYDGLEAFIEYSNDMQDTYKNI